jgi:hypothetical protein
MQAKKNETMLPMNKLARFCRLTFAILVLATVGLPRASGMVFTENTVIGPQNTNYDGQDIVILDCTVTVDGPHTFSSLVLAANGVLTHSFSATGMLPTTLSVTNAPYVLNETTPDELANSNIFSAVFVTDTNGDVYTNGADYLVINQTNGTYISTEIERTSTSSIPDGGTVLVSYSYDGTVPAGLDLTVTGVVWVTSGCEIDADGIGYGGGFGPGAGNSSSNTYFDGSGGGNGGGGGMSLSNAVGGVCYDSLYQPGLPGSGGGASYAGSGGNGGGLVRIAAGDEVEIDGVISANGGSTIYPRAGGGSGGGIWISAPSVSGAGSLSANGGAGAPNYGGGGGGGRVAIVCGTNNFAGTISADGGGGATYGGAGTVFTELTGLPGLLTLNNNGKMGANSTVSLPNAADVAISNGAVVAVSPPFQPDNLTIGTNGVLTGVSQELLQLSMSNLTLTAGGTVSVNGLGYPVGGLSPGGNYSSGGIIYGGGGGHGGIGGAAAVTNAYGGGVNDGETDPAIFGSSGGGGSGISGAGGGTIRVYATGTLQINGLISANGSDGTGLAGGGGAGGSVYLGAGTVSGNGTVTANGGAGANSLGGGGGGGRIEIFADTYNFTGTANCFGGGGANYGGEGTVFLDQYGAWQNLVLDNDGNMGPSTPLQQLSGANLFVQDGAWATLPNGSVFQNLVVTSNAWVTIPSGSQLGTVTISSNATFEAGGGLTVNAGGGLQGPGFGQGMTFYPYAGGGGGNGGAGGAGITNIAAGGVAGFNSITGPSYPGGNGGGFYTYSVGGIGGGVLRLTVGGTLAVNGTISATGGNGSGEGGGGGAGGSLALSAGTLSGSGSITANGGNGADSVGGGGGGGIIDITFNTDFFNGTMSAFGGVGAHDGGAGVIYIKTNSFANGQIIVDNGGENGGSTSIGTSYQATGNLTVGDGATLSYSTPVTLSLANLLITNASLVVSNYPLTINANNIFVQNGGRISADAGGYAQGTGNGAGKVYGVAPYYPGSGGGNGGCGGSAFSNTVAGGSGGMQSYTQPIQPGSGGGGENPYSIGGPGGGVVEMNVSGVLAVNGTVSASGGNGGGTGGGGGAGGSLDLNVNGLTGSGAISANGGNGVSNIGGGGGGGMIAINFQSASSSNLFTGLISAYGGMGATSGGAGTIFIKTNSTGQATLIVDNGGNRGTNSPIMTSSSLYSIQVRNGAIAAVPSSVENFSTLLITSNAWVVPLVTQPGQIGEVDLSLASGGTIQAGGGVIADFDGYAQNAGPGHGSSYLVSPTFPCSGAGHGGDGAFSVSNLIAGGATYDSITAPLQAGSGGGGTTQGPSIGGNGGGIIFIGSNLGGLVVSDLRVDGIISANGGNGSGIGGGGGSGGTIGLSGRRITGTGTITANGGNGAGNGGGGGGGGCIEVFSSGELGTNVFLGNASAYGGGGANYGGAGTLYFRTNNTFILPGPFSPIVYLDNGNNVGTDTTLNVSGINVVVQNGAIGAIATSVWDVGAVLVHSNSELTSLIGQTTVRATSLTISTGGVFSVDGCGYGAQVGPGAGLTIGGIAGGGGHGGYGGGNISPASLSGMAYDSVQAPTAEGSGGANASTGKGGGGAGGGALTLDVSAGLVVNGRISANGRAGGLDAGGGSGGSIDIGQALSLSGNGTISANGGPSEGLGGGGGGGRIAITAGANTFNGQYSASGGGGGSAGGAGTIFTSVAGGQTLLVNNGGQSGAETPLSSALGMPSTPFELDISGGAAVAPFTPLPLLSNLNVSASSTLTMPVAQSNLFIGVMGEAGIMGDLDVDYLGYLQTNGPGAGSTVDNEGSGAGYGGAGGASDSGAHGGKTYGSAVAPTDFGSGGGNGVDTTTGGSAGGGALRLSVAGTLTVNGNISANGDSGLQDDSGGGSGGSVWITARTLSGSGTISAYGGDGAFYGGGGGGGGRIAIYTSTNDFTGTTNASGGTGAVPGQSGTVSLAGTLDGLQILSESPTGLVMSTVSSVNLAFSGILNAGSVSPSDFTVITPGGPLAQSNLNVTLESPYSVQLNFPTQSVSGTYTVQAAAATISDMFGQALGQTYTGTFTISLPLISGTVTGTNGAGVAGVSMQASGGVAAATTDSNGNYSLEVPAQWAGTVTPSFGSYAFVPSSMSYTNVTGTITNQNYSMVPTISPTLTPSLSAGNCSLTWNGIPGVTYQVLWSTNLVTWQPIGSPLAGTNGPMQMVLPSGSNSEEFFQIRAGD